MSVEGQCLEDLSEDQLKKLLETASDYQERSQIRSILRKIRKSRGEVADTSKSADYKRRGHQIEVNKFKLDQPTYYSHVSGASNLRKEAAINVPKPKHFIPSMMSPMVKRRDSEDMLSSEGSRSSLSTVHSYADRTALNQVEDSYEKETAIRSHSYGFEQKQHHSPDLGYPESPDPNTPSLERPSYSSEHTEESDDHAHDRKPNSEKLDASPQFPQEQDITLTESQLEQTASDASVESTEQKMHSSKPPTQRNYSQSNRKVSDAVSQEADGELDQLTQKLAYSDNPEEQVQLRRKIRETREIAGRGRMQKHTSFIKIDVKKGSKAESDSSSPQQSPNHALDEIDEQTHTPVNIGESMQESMYSREQDVSPADLSSSPVELELETQNMISNQYSSDELEDERGYQYQQNPYTDLTQLPGEEPLTGRKPRVKADGGIDFTNVLNKSDKHLAPKKSPRAPVEQHSFKGVLRKNSPLSSTSPSSVWQLETSQMDFRNVLTNKVTTNQHKYKPAPVVASKPTIKNKRDSPPTVESEESLPQHLVFESDPLQRSPSPDQLPAPVQPQQHIPNANSNNCQETTEEAVSVDSSSQAPAKEHADAAIQEDEAALAYRRNSLQTGQDSRKRLRAMYKQNSLSKLRQSITDIDIPLPSGDSIPEEMSRTDPMEEKDSPRIGLVEDPSPIKSPSKPASQDRVSACLVEPEPEPESKPEPEAEPEQPKLSSYEQRRLERKKKREMSGRCTDEEVPSPAITQKYSNSRSRRENGETSSMKSAKDSYLKTAGVNDKPISRSPTSSPNSHSSRTLNWAKSQTRGYNVEIKDLSHSWKDGLAFCALIHSYLPGEFDFESLSASNPKENMDLAFQVANNYGIPKLFDPEDILEMHVPDQRSIMTYLSTIYKGLHNQ